MNGYSSSSYGVGGRSNSQIGVYGQSYASFSAGVYGLSAYIGTQGIVNGSDSDRQAIRGDNGGSATGYAGLFYGNTWTVGTLYKNAGAFRIDHPLDPANKYLNHSFVESPDMKNIYDGVATLDATGAAVVELPDWFEALNKDFRYQLTAIGAPGAWPVHRPGGPGQPVQHRRRRAGHEGLVAGHRHPPRPVRRAASHPGRGGQTGRRARHVHLPRRLR